MKLTRANKNENSQSELKSTKNKALNKNYINKLSAKELNELMKEYMEDLFPKKNENKSKSYEDSYKMGSDAEENSEEESEKKYMYIPTIKQVINSVAVLNAKDAQENPNANSTNKKNNQNTTSNQSTQNDQQLQNLKAFNFLNNLSSNSNLINIDFSSLNSFGLSGNKDNQQSNGNYLNTGNNANKLILPSIKKESEIFVLAYSPDDKNNKIIYSGGSDTHIHLWDFINGIHVDTWKAHKKSVISMCFDGYYLLSGGEDGVINVWNTFDRSLLFSLKDGLNDIPNRIQDLYMLNKFGILIAITGEKKINFWKYQSRELLKSVNNKKECLCIGIVESYGKILFGTKDKTIIELDMGEILDSIGIKHGYNKAPFMNEDPNFIIDSNGKFILIKTFFKVYGIKETIIFRIYKFFLIIIYYF